MKRDNRVERVPASLDVLHFPASALKPVGALCLNCSSSLTLHQPDTDSPERLLAVCEHCKHWFLIDLLLDVSEGVMVRLPDTEVIRGLSRKNPSDGISLLRHEPDPEPITRLGPSGEPGR